MAAKGIGASPVGLGRIVQHSDIVLAVAVVAVMGMMIVPLPSALLDVLIVFNIALAAIILMVSMYTVEPLDFSVFPSLLLIVTLYRLGLNISATRLILLHAHAGKVINAFGNIVVGGNYIVGIVVFLILMIIQFVVITSGAGRVAEVAARFTLDAMPGKQMSIDADLNAGLIDEQEARRRRIIEQEADFYGAMDGASKFVKGDAIAGVVIILINIFGGFAIGALQLHMPLTQALQTYTLLTVGEGLVTQIPALLVSTATGIIVTRAASESTLGRDVAGQILANPRPLAIVAGMLLVLAVVPGLPKLPFLAIGTVAGGLTMVLRRAQKEMGGAPTTEEEVQIAGPSEAGEDFVTLLQVDPLELEIGYGLIPLVDVAQGGNLLNRVSLIRRQIAQELGIILPKIRIRDNLRLEPNTYVIKLRGEEIAKGELITSHYLAMNTGLTEERLEGMETTEPAFGLPAIWITPAQKERAEMLGYAVVDPSSVLITHLTEIIKAYAPELLGRREVQQLVNNIRADYPSLLEELVPELLTIGQVQLVLQNLLRERVSIRDLVSILEVLVNNAPQTKDALLLAEYARQALARTISNQYRGEDGVIRVITLSPEVEDLVAGAIQQERAQLRLDMPPEMVQELVQRVGEEAEKLAIAGYQPIVLNSSRSRWAFKKLTERLLPNLVVLSFNEIASQVEVYSSGMVELKHEG